MSPMSFFSAPTASRSSKSALKSVAIAALAALVLTACAGDSGSTEADGSGGETGPQIVATTTQLGSIASQMTECAGGNTITLMDVSDDPHQFAVSSQQVVQMVEADLVLANGLNLEASMQDSLDNAATDGANILYAAELASPLPFGSVAHDHADDHAHDHGAEDHAHAEEAADHEGHDHGSLDPHFWMDVSRMATVAQELGDQLAEGAETTEDADRHRECTTQLVADLNDTHQQVTEILAEAAAEEPTLVTDHDAYQYFADAYGLLITGIVVPGGSTDGEASSAAIAELAELLDNAGADAMVTNKMTPNPVMENLAADHGENVPLVLMYEGGLGGPGSEAETYQDGMIYNAEALAKALS